MSNHFTFGLLQCILQGTTFKDHLEVQLIQFVLTCSPLLYWLAIGFQVYFKMLVIMYTALYGIGSGCLRDWVIQSFLAPAVRSSSPSIKYCHLVKFRKYAFSLAAPILWNKISPKIRMVPSLLGFWKSLKTWLWSQDWGWYWSLFNGLFFC